MKIAKIVSSNSHIDYVGRVIDALDADRPPQAEDYGFAQFVTLPITAENEIVGVIYNSQLINPDYGHFGPRLSPPADLSLLSPDYLNEQGVLIGILLLGWREGETHAAGVPRRVIPVGQDVRRMGDEEMHLFHQDAHGRLQIHYYSQVIAHAGPFALPLIESVIAQLEPVCEAEERQRLGVLKKSLVWQRTLGGMRL
ncbi:MAG TPA: hypothetical protein VM870_10585 [Pyrinomonadaceae bacterium]|jgi:hypothetical protein|nr:hypothetical protein [Pyrinomonadaceae bacterium]